MSRLAHVLQQLVLIELVSFEKECQALQKDSKGYLDAMRGMTQVIPRTRNGRILDCPIYSYDYHAS